MSQNQNPSLRVRVDRRLLGWIWSLPGVLYAIQGWAFAGPDVAFGRILGFCLPLWWFYIPATFLVLRLADRLPLTRDLEPAVPSESTPGPWLEAGPKSWAAHGLAATATAAVHMVFILYWSRLLSPLTIPAFSGRSYLHVVSEPIFMVSLSSYLLILCGHYVVALAGRLQERNQQEDRLLGRLAEAEIRSLRMQLRPDDLAESLDDISRRVRAGELDEAESAIGKLARDLRETLRHGDNLPEVWSNPDLEPGTRRRRPS